MDIQVVLAVKDVKKAKEFYMKFFDQVILYDFGENIAFESGLSLQEDFDWLTGIEKKDIKMKSNNMEIYFEINDFTNFAEKLKENNIEFIHNPKQSEWGQWSPRIYDLDNHIIEIGESMFDVVKRFYTQGYTIEEIAKRMDVTEEYIEEHLK